MYDYRRKHEWAVQNTRDPLVVMRALSPFLHKAFQPRSLWYVHTDGYVLQSQTTTIEKVKDLEHSARRVPDEMHSVSLQYETPIKFLTMVTKRPDCKFTLTAGNSWIAKNEPFPVSLVMLGPDTDAMAGIMDRIKTQIDSEFARQEAADWTATPTDLDFPVRSWTHRFLNNQWIVGIILAIFGILLAAALTFLGKLIDDHNRDRAPQPTTSNVVTGEP